ncbi:MAG: hypothetical protein ACR2GR_00215 [Rhodothermales bacterium]
MAPAYTRLRSGIKRVDVDELYDADAYRPKVRHVMGKPMFLYGVSSALLGPGADPTSRQRIKRTGSMP